MNLIAELEAAVVRLEELRLVYVAALATDIEQDKYDTSWAWIHAKDDAMELGRQYKRLCKVEGRDPKDWKQHKTEEHML